MNVSKKPCLTKKNLLTTCVGAYNVFIDCVQKNHYDDGEKNHIICFELNLQKNPCSVQKKIQEKNQKI